MHVNAISFLSTVLAMVGVMAVSLYGAVRCFRASRFLAGFGLLAIIPAWFVGQILVVAVFDKLMGLGMVSRENHLQYAATPVLNIVVVFLVGYAVIRFVRGLKASPGRTAEPMSQVGADDGTWLFEPRRIVGIIIVALGAVTIPFEVISGTLLVVVGVSLIMDVRLWRR